MDGRFSRHSGEIREPDDDDHEEEEQQQISQIERRAQEFAETLSADSASA